MDKPDLTKKILEDEDYIRCPKCQNSLAKFVSKNPDGVENNVIARLLMIPEEEVEKLYNESVEKLRLKMSKE